MPSSVRHSQEFWPHRLMEGDCDGPPEKRSGESLERQEFSDGNICVSPLLCEEVGVNEVALFSGIKDESMTDMYQTFRRDQLNLYLTLAVMNLTTEPFVSQLP